MSEVRRIAISNEHDIVLCRRACREVAKEYGFNLIDQTRITTAASELARNIYEYASTGEVTIEYVNDEAGNPGIKLVFTDNGPGIENIDEAMHEGWTSNRGMGLGLPGSKKLMDDFHINSTPNKGTVITATKWQR